MLLCLLALASLALGQEDAATTGGGTLADMTVGEMIALFGGGGGTVGISGSGYSLWRLKKQDDVIEELRTKQDAAIAALRAEVNDHAEAIEKATDQVAAIRATMGDMDARITATNAPSEADASLRERLARLETQHDERHQSTRQSFTTLRATIESVHKLLIESRRG